MVSLSVVTTGTRVVAHSMGPAVVLGIGFHDEGALGRACPGVACLGVASRELAGGRLNLKGSDIFIRVKGDLVAAGSPWKLQLVLVLQGDGCS